MKSTPAASAPDSAESTPGSESPDLSSAFDNALIGMTLIAPDNRFLRVNRAFCEFVGYSSQEVLERTLVDLVHPQDLEEDRRERALLLAGQKDSYRREKRYVHKSGQVLWGDYSCILVRDRDGRPLHYVAQVQDITQNKRAQHDLQESEARFRSLSALSSDWYWEQDHEFRFTRFQNNARTPAWREKRLASVIGKRRWELPTVHPVRGDWAQHQALLMAHQPFLDFEYNDDDTGRCVVVSGEPVFAADGTFAGYRGTARDVTQTRLIEKKLQQAQALMGIAVELGRVGAWAYEVASKTLTCSAELYAVLQVKAQVAPTPRRALEFFVTDYRPRLVAILKTCLDNGSPFDIECEVITGRGERAWVRILCEAEWDGHGRVKRLNGALQDISASKRTELEIARLNQHLEERVRQRTHQLELANAELEAFAYSIAHDLRGPMTALAGFTRLLEQNLGDLDPRNAHYLRRVLGNVQHMNELTDSLLSLARLSGVALESQPTDLAVAARKILEELRLQEPHRNVVADIPATLPTHGDPRLLHQVMANLIGNAWKFSRTKPVTEIRVAVETDANGEEAFVVADRGVGFDMQHASELFGPFRRLHSGAEFEGTGIGLALVRKIVVRHGGRVWAHAEPGAGATIRFTLSGPNAPPH
jgi:PAS domain S-box-containing protein